MEYIPLVQEYANVLMPAAIAFVITSVIFYLWSPSTDHFQDITPWWNVAISSVIAVLFAGVAAASFSYIPNTRSNLESTKTNVETKYDVTASNVTKLKGDDTASVFSMYIVNNKEQSGHNATVIVSAEGVPALIGFESLKR